MGLRDFYMLRFNSNAIAAVVVAVFFIAFSSTSVRSEDSFLTKTIERAMNDDIYGAAQAAKKSSDPDYADSIIEVLRIYRAPSSIPLGDVAAFLKKHSWMPEEVFLPKIEKSINHNTAPEEVVEWFAYKEPTTPRGKFFLVHANLNLKKLNLDNEEVKSWLRQLWRSTQFDLDSEEYIIKRYKNIFTVDDLLKKIDQSIWNGNLTFAKKLISILPNSYHAPLLTKVAVAQKPSTARQYLKGEVNKADEFILYTYIKEELAAKNEATAFKYLVPYKPKSNFDKWWKLKNVAVRTALNSKNYKAAYAMCTNHGLTEGVEFTEAEWMAGWIALDFLDKPSVAAEHFERMLEKSKLANSRSKASYWLARSYEASDNSSESQKYFEEASMYSGTFYGQLAISRMHGSSKYNYFDSYKDHGRGDALQSDKDKIKKVTLLSYHLFKANYKSLAYKLIESIPNLNLDRTDMEAAAFYFTKRGLEPLAVELGKASANKSYITIKEGYPRNINISHNELPKSLYYAIIRQESNFDPIAVSPAGAMGLMQIMPETGRRLAQRLGLPKDGYARNPALNVRKGVAYLDQLHSQYGSLILTIAAYNAGPGNVKKWVEMYGDPSRFKSLDKKLNWIESIPFAETRNYVKKVLENMVIYDSMLSSNHNAKSIIKFLDS